MAKPRSVVYSVFSSTHRGPGYRVYFSRRGKVIYLLLIGGDKATQKRDIQRARQLACDLKSEG